MPKVLHMARGLDPRLLARNYFSIIGRGHSRFNPVGIEMSKQTISVGFREDGDGEPSPILLCTHCKTHSCGYAGRVRLAGSRLAGWPDTSRNQCSRPARTVFSSHNNQLKQYFSVLPNRPLNLPMPLYYFLWMTSSWWDIAPPLHVRTLYCNWFPCDYFRLPNSVCEIASVHFGCPNWKFFKLCSTFITPNMFW